MRFYILVHSSAGQADFNEIKLSSLADHKPALKGDYVIKLWVSRKSKISYGRYKDYELAKGYYLYFGSARGSGGLFSRVSRHLDKDAVVHWHIDKLKHFTVTEEVYIIPSEIKYECRMADYTGNLPGFVKIPDFGCSDCGCPSHLVHSPNNINLKQILKQFLKNNSSF